jgi:ABC-type transporter Mla maintaining outer membrane lipid asymmetry permease subunit MlaE
LTFVREVVEQSTSRQLGVDQRGLPAGVQRLLALAAAVPEQEEARRRGAPLPWLDGIGTAVLAGWQGAWDILGFIGDTVLAGLRLMAGQARFRRVDLALFLQQCGAQALGIVTLVSFLVGLILAFVGAVQLRQFGAQIYVADLVGLAITREMGAMMTGVILVSITLLHMPLIEYLNETRLAVDLVDCGIGVGKSVVFGALVALAGCLRGMQSGRSAAAVGAAATSAVVTGIVWIIASDGVFAVVTERLGI